MIIEGKTFVVTGGASGLGEGTTRECVARSPARSPARARSRRCLIMASLRPSPRCRIVARGGNVAIFDLNEERAAGIVAELGDAAAFFECNVMEEESIDAAVAAAHAHFKELHGAVCCAGGQIGAGLTVNRRGEAFGMKNWWNTVKLNAFGTFAVCSKVAAITSQQEAVTEDGERGVLVNVASVAAQDGQDGQSAYSAGKGAIVAMTLPMARDLSRVGIRVNTILPGTMGTPMTKMMDPDQGAENAVSVRRGHADASRPRSHACPAPAS